MLIIHDMKEIFLGLLVIAGIIVLIYIVLVIVGIFGIFLTNLFSSASYMPYNWSNIRHVGSKGIAILICVFLVLLIAHLFGSAITL